MVFTLPRHLAPLVLQNKKVIYDLLFRTSAETLLEVARNPQHLGAEIGFFSVLHSWSQKLETHPHVHCVVPAGGLSPDHTHWVSASERFGLPFSIYDSAAGTLFGPATTFTTGSLAPGATLESSSRSGSVSSRVNEFFNTSAFVPAPLIPNGGLIDGIYPVSGSRGTIFGNLGRNILRGPDQRVGDIAVIKNTPLTEHVKLVFRWEVFNVLNRPHFANPSSDVSTPGTFGVISALTVNPRIMQYALKLEF
ncbi:MAG TPA: transposase [Candidatus Limnocylindrales bacterium]|nr:transposase [Candidatus Limnocylindrales bacterium]